MTKVWPEKMQLASIDRLTDQFFLANFGGNPRFMAQQIWLANLVEF